MASAPPDPLEEDSTDEIPDLPGDMEPPPSPDPVTRGRARPGGTA